MPILSHAFYLVHGSSKPGEPQATIEVRSRGHCFLTTWLKIVVRVGDLL